MGTRAVTDSDLYINFDSLAHTQGVLLRREHVNSENQLKPTLVIDLKHTSVGVARKCLPNLSDIFSKCTLFFSVLFFFNIIIICLEKKLFIVDTKL